MTENLQFDTTNGPFPGLRGFTREESDLFFGRGEQVANLDRRLNDHRLLVLGGDAGCGKSSLVHAGLVPLLANGASGRRVATFRPGADPVGNLAAALAETLATRGGASEGLAAHLLDGGMATALRASGFPEDGRLLVVADQFEDLFRYRNARSAQHTEDDTLTLTRILLDSVQQEELAVDVVIVLRSEFVGECTAYPGLAEAINNDYYLVPRMGTEALRQAVVGPVEARGAAVSPALLERLLDDADGFSQPLPRLQHALACVWEEWKASRVDAEEPLDLRHYETVGSMHRAISQQADRAFAELDEEGQELAAGLFKALTEKEGDTAGVRRPQTISELCNLHETEGEVLCAVVEHFRRPGLGFLLPAPPEPLAPSSVVDLSSQALLSSWQRLADWMDDEARSARTYRQLAAAAALRQLGQGGLWRDPELATALNWKKETRPTVAWARRYAPAFERAMLFLEESRKQREREIERRERRRRQQLVWARRLALGAALAALAFALLGLFALEQSSQARSAREEAVKQREEAVLAKDLALEAKDEAENQRRQAVTAKAEAETQRTAAERARDEADGLRLQAVAARDEAEDQRLDAVLARDEAKEQEQLAVEAREQEEQERQRAEAARKEAVAQHDKASRLSLLAGARALAEQSLRLIPAGRDELAALLAVEAYRLHTAAYDRPGDGADSPLGGDRQRDPSIYGALVNTWAALSPEALQVPTELREEVRAFAVAGSVLAVGGQDGRVELHRLDARRPERRPPERRPPERRPPERLATPQPWSVRSLAIDPRARYAAAGGLEGRVRRWLLDGSGEFLDLEVAGAAAAHDNSVYGLAFAGGTLVSGGGATLRLWNPANGEPTGTLGDEGPAGLALAASGDRLATIRPVVRADGDGGSELSIWDLAPGAPAPAEPSRRLVRPEKIRSLAFAPGSDQLAAGTYDGQVLLWRSLDDEPQVLERDHGSQVRALAWSTSGLLASGSLDGHVHLWQLNGRGNDAPPLHLALDHWVWAVALTPDGSWLVAGNVREAAFGVNAWPTRSGPVAEQICNYVRRELTADEKREYMPQDLDFLPTCPEAHDASERITSLER